MRINTLLDAMLIAQAFNAGFAFHWDETEQPALDSQTTGSLAAVFDVAFRRRHHRPGPPDMRAPILDQPLRDSMTVATARAAGAASGQLLLDRPHDLATFFGALGPFPTDAYRDAFDTIGFARPVRAAITAARTVPIAEGAAAIHLRGGDILHGTHSFHGTYLHKAPSLAEIDTIIASLRDQGRSIWLIGQEPDVQAAMIARHPGVLAFGITHPLPVGLTPVGAVLFDAVFMARMTDIFGGNSGVTQLSRRIGRTVVTDIGSPPPCTSAEPLLRIVHDAGFQCVSAASLAHVCSKAVIATTPDRWTHTHLDLIRTARSFRPANAFLQLVEACVIARILGPEAGEEAGRRFFTAPPLEPGIAPDMGFSFLMGGDHYFPTGIVTALTPRAGPTTALLVALSKTTVGQMSQPEALSALAEAEAALAPTGINPALRARIMFFLGGPAPST